jgi:replication-associated recombination protein RarA
MGRGWKGDLKGVIGPSTQSGSAPVFYVRESLLSFLVQDHGALPVPKALRNAVTSLMKSEGYGEGYRYPHDYPGHFVPGETYLPQALKGERFYEPSDQGVERQIADRLARLAAIPPPDPSK